MKGIRIYVEQYCIINMVNLETGTFCYFSLTYTVKITLTNMFGTGIQAYKNQNNILMPKYIKKTWFSLLENADLQNSSQRKITLPRKLIV